VSYEPDSETGLFRAEYADVLGVPYIFATEGKDTSPKPPAKTTRIKAQPERADRRIEFPNVEGYRIVYPRERLKAEFSADSRLLLTPDDVPTKTLNEPLIGEGTFLGFDAEKKYRDRSVAYQVAGHTLRTFFRDDDGSVQVWRYPDLLRITEEWMEDYLVTKGGVPKQILRWPSLAQRAAEKIARACTPAKSGAEAIRPILNAYNRTGSTRHVQFDTTRTTLFETRADRCHLNFVVYDKDWEAGFAQRIEEMDEVVAYVKNHNLHFEVPYLHYGESRHYRPDYIVRLDDGRGPNDLLNLVVEIKGLRDDADAAKAETVRKIWLPAVNNSKSFGRWDFIEFQSAPYDVATLIRAHLNQQQAA
jgi:type III restriction enzyme